MPDTNKIIPEQSVNDMHAAMGHTVVQNSDDSTSADLNTNDSCCEDCSCVMSPCQNQFGLINNSEQSFKYQKFMLTSYSNLLDLNNTPALPFRPPIV